MYPWEERDRIFDRDIWARDFILALVHNYLEDGGNAVKLIQNKRTIGDLIAANGKGCIDTDFYGLAENIAHKWLEAKGTVGDWECFFDQILFETWRG